MRLRDLLRLGVLSGLFISILPMALPASAQPACEPEKLATKYPALAGKKLKIGQDGESAPFSHRDPKDFNKLIGLDADMARAVFACAGVPIEFITGAWSGLIPAAMSGQIDVMWDTLLYTPERAKRMDFVAYMNSASGVVVAKGNPKKMTAIDGMCGMIGTAGLGTTQEAMLRQSSEKCVAAGNKPIEIITSTDIPAGLRLVQNSRADALVTNKFLGDIMAATVPGVEMTFSIVTGARIGAGTAKGNDDLIKAIFDGLSVLKANGELKKIYEANKVDYSLVTEPEILTK
ncbi:ABC transporter substrate-binding protein [soil metagenome]